MILDLRYPEYYQRSDPAMMHHFSVQKTRLIIYLVHGSPIVTLEKNSTLLVLIGAAFDLE
jgi:hypothetical protein